MQRRISPLIVVSTLVALVPALPASAMAAEIEGDAGNSDSSTIVVTGTLMQSESSSGALGSKAVIDTPYSVTVIDAEDIAKRQATTIGQIFINDPSVSSFATAGTTNWWGTQIRGIGVRNYYVDKVPLLLYWGGDYPLEAVESVEALKGLSGFMYGFGEPGGVISYRSKRPTAEPMLTTSLGYRSESVFYGHLDAGGPLTGDGRLRYRANIAGEKGTAYNKAGVNRWLSALALEYDISPDVQWYARATFEQSNLEHEPFQIYWRRYTGKKLPRPTYDYDNLHVDNSFYKTDMLATSTGLGWQVAPNWKLDLDYGYTRKLHRSNKMFTEILNEAGDYRGYAFNFAELDQYHFAQLMLQGRFATGPIEHEIVAGLSFMDTANDYGANSHYNNDFNGNIYRRQSFLVTRDIDFSTKGGPYKDRQYAAFISDTLHLGEYVQAIAGVRYTRYKLLDVDGDPQVASGYLNTAATPTLALIYKPAPYVSLYGSYVESMEGGGRVSDDYANAGDILKPTLSRQYEVGAKYAKDGLDFTLAAFRVERAAAIDQLPDGADKPTLTQDGMTLYKGVEAILAYRATPQLKLGAGVVHLDPNLRDVSAGNEALRGNIPAQAARWQLLVNAEYAVPAVEGLSVHGNVRYFGKAPTDDSNLLFIPARTLANAGIQYATTIGGRAVTFTGNVNNVLNKKYWTHGAMGEAINGAFGVKIGW